MHTNHIHTSTAFEISPDLERVHPASLSTHWIPLDELIAHWTEVDLLLSHPPVAALMAAIGSALLAFARESSALRCYTLAWGQREDMPPDETESRFNEVGRSLLDAAHQWHRAACTLEHLSPTDLDPPALQRARRLARVARAQQARLWALTSEVGEEVQAWHWHTAQQERMQKEVS